ncbi:MAG: DNA translocase FtsK 4TM domain-containing protein [Phycisphaerae bacterium]|mgnify:CR=1 FL=1|nr:DNA translocase FtsK 4TM domain-containing protein [Phycisphaerae bacterium]
MARKPTSSTGTSPRSRSETSTSAASVVAAILPEAGVTRRLLWVVAGVMWVFTFLAMASFNAADWPSHVVSVHNEPAANLLGRVGGVFAFWTYMVLGIGVWVPILLSGVALAFLAIGRPVPHPTVRAIGGVIMMIALSCLHAAWMPTVGPLTGCDAGLLPMWASDELVQRFGGVGCSLLAIGAFLLGAIVAMDEVVFALPAALSRTLSFLDPILEFDYAGTFAALKSRLTLQRPQPIAVGVGATARRTVRTSAKPASVADVDAEALDAALEDAAAVPTKPVAPKKRVKKVVEIDDEVDIDTDDVDEADETELDTAVEKPRLTEAELRAKIAKLPIKMATAQKILARDEDIPREQNFEGYQFPTLEMLEEPERNFSQKMESIVRDQATVLEQALHTFQIQGEVVGIESGPVVTLYSVELAPGTRVARLETISKDIARALQAPNIRIIPNMVGRTAVGIEVPNRQKEKVRLKELMSGKQSEGMILPMFLGKDSAGEPLVLDLCKMPHMLIAGTTGSGKSVCMNTIIMSWLYTKRPDELKLVLVDPKMVEMSQFADIPHLMCPVVTEMNKAAGILEWAVNKMEERYELLKEAGVRDIRGYNELGEAELFERMQPKTDLEKAKLPKKLPYMVFVIDELADLIMTNKEVETSIVRIAQKARAVGIHLILATQRPQANVVTGLIKSNMPCRCSFKVASGMDSRIVLDQKGSELLLGQGDMLVLTPTSTELRRCQGTLVTDSETRRVAKFLKEVAAPTFERTLIAIKGTQAQAAESGSGIGDGGLNAIEKDPLFEKAVEIIIESGRGSVSLLQRRLAVGYGRASRLVDQMGLAGILGEHNGSVAREVIISMDDWKRMQAMAQEHAADGTVFDPKNVDDDEGL